MREYRRTHALTPDQRMKMNARSYAHVYLRRGKIEWEPCEVCGSGNSEMHHDDYARPTLVRWFCRKHHLEHHAKGNSEADSARSRIVPSVETG